ncbi:MAG: ATP-binding protein [Mediterraneibacter gnavus]
MTEIQDSIQIYEAMVKTGNDVLDTILTEKSLACKANNIVVSCVADGEGLEFLHPVDLYTIFGNAMDNAIECVKHFKEKEKRQIDVLIHRQHQFLIVQIMNPVERELEFEDNLPVTTKHDKDYHGYGLRSIKNTVKKYNGVFQVKIKDGCFCLKILFPVKKEWEKVPMD